MRLFPDTVLANPLNSADSAYHLYAGLQSASDNTNDPNDIIVGQILVEPWVQLALFVEPAAQLEDCFDIYTGDSGYIYVPPTPDPDVTPDPDPPPAVPTGFSAFAKHTSATAFYVSESEGDDTNDGLTIGTPVKTITKALTLVTQGKGDHILLKRGDTWDASASNLEIRGKGGLNADYPTVIKPYGVGVMPIVQQPILMRPNNTAGDANFFAIQGIQISQTYAFRSTAAVKNPFALHISTGGSGITLQDIWIEGCRIVGMGGSVITSTFNGTFFRNTILDQYVIDTSTGTKTHPHCQGLFVGAGGGGVWRIEENVFDQCGGFLSTENVVVDGVDSGVTASSVGAVRTWFNHALYFSQASDVSPANITIQKNLISRSGLAVQARQGGTVSNNVFVVNAVHLEVGHQQQTNTTTTATVDSNLFLGTEDSFTSASPYPSWTTQVRARAIEVDTCNSVTVSNNIGGDHGRNNTSSTGFCSLARGVGTTPTATFQDNSTRNWDTPWLTPTSQYEYDSDSTYAESTSGGDFQDGSNTATTLFDVALADAGGTYAGYYAKVRAFDFDAWTADYYSTLYSAASAAL